MGSLYDDRDLDSFWNLDLLMPRKHKKPSPASFSPAVQAIDVPAQQGTVPADREALRLSAIASQKEGEVQEYIPQGNRLLRRVRIIRRPVEYQFYGRFCRDAQRYLEAEGQPCDFAPFFSYIPQYAQLNEAQFAYYLYWRSCLRRGEYLKTEESYFYLYVYEIINLPELIEPKEGILLLCRAWQAYRKAFPRMDKYMAVWVCDYCLLHALPCPDEALHSFLGKILPLAGLREFYLGSMGDLTPRGVRMALELFSDYRWQQSRYAALHPALYEEHLVAALTPILAALFENEKLFSDAACSHRAQDAFCGSLCAYHVKCRIEVDYYAIRDVADLRRSLTAAVKYAENCLRAMLSVRSRLSVGPLAPALRTQIDAYFAGARARICPPDMKEEPAYERLYDAPSSSVSFARAADIEKQSWATTKLLVTEEEETETVPPSQSEAIQSDMPQATPEKECLTEQERTYLSCLLHHDRDGVRHLLKKLSRLEEELADCINEKAAVLFSDILLECTESGYQIIEDYSTEVMQWIL